MSIFCSCDKQKSISTEVDINEARIACDNLENRYKNIYRDWLIKNNIEYQENDNAITFEYQGGNFVITKYSDDLEFFSLILPCIAEINEDNFGAMLTAIMEINKEKKCVKSFVIDGKVCLSTEIMLDQTPEIERIMPRLLSRLHASRLDFYGMIASN